MKYNLINKKTKKEIICSKVVVDGFDYYVVDKKPKDYVYIKTKNEILKVRGIGEKSGEVYHKRGFNFAKECQRIIATNNPAYKNLPKVIKTVTLTSLFMEKDMLSFGEFCIDYDYRVLGKKTVKELLKHWVNKRNQTVYYE
jgi:hypothetical protein